MASSDDLYFSVKVVNGGASASKVGALTQARAVWTAEDEKTIKFFEERLRAGPPIPALVGMKGEDGRIVILDGRKRFEAARRCGLKHIGVHTIPHTLTDDQAAAFRAWANSPELQEARRRRLLEDN